MQRLLTPEGIEYDAPTPTCHNAITAHAENVPRPVADDFNHTNIPEELWNSDSFWSPPGPQGMQIVSMMGGMNQYLQMERLLLTTGMAILDHMLTNNDIRRLYVRISGYEFPDEIDEVLELIIQVLGLISQRQRSTIDLWLDIASSVNDWDRPLISNTVRQVQNSIKTTSHIQNVAILWQDSVRYRKLISMDGCTGEEMPDIQYLDLFPRDMRVDLIAFITQLPNSIKQLRPCARCCYRPFHVLFL